MKCTDCVPWIDRKLEGSLSGHQLRELEDHLAGCRRCREELLLQESIVEALKEDETPSGLSMEFTQRVSARVREMPREKVRRRWPALVPMLALGTAIAVVALFVADLAQIATWRGVADSLYTTFTLFGGAVARLFSNVPSLSSGALVEPSPTAMIIIGSIVSVIPMIWSFRRMYAFLRD